MRKRFIRISSLLLILALVLSGINMQSVSAASGYSIHVAKSGIIENPLYPVTDAEQATTVTYTPKQYYSSGETFNVELCTTNYDEIVAQLREAMVARKASVYLYYQNTAIFDNESIGEFITELLENVLAETNKANEGDYLAYVYQSCSAGSQTLYYPGQPEYYHKITVNLGYYTTKAQEDQLDATVNSVIDSFNFTQATTQKEKADTIYDYITSHVTYDFENLDDDSYKLKYSAYAALINGTAVCQGYATLFYRLARECGLDARVIAGTSEGENHAWNIVKLGDYYYYVDSTWDAGETNYSYYLKGSDDFPDHESGAGFKTPDFVASYPIDTRNFDATSQTEQATDDDYNVVYTDGIEGGAIYFDSTTGTISDCDATVTSAIIPDKIAGVSVTSIGSRAFFNCKGLTSVTIPNSVTSIGDYAFSGCKGLTSVTIPGSVTSMGSILFAYCTNLASVIFAEGVTEIGEYAFYGCGRLASVTIPGSVTSIGRSAFEGGILTSITIPEGVATIGDYAFASCNGLTSVTIPEGVTSIGNYAFWYCKGLTSVTIPRTVTAIGKSAFDGENQLSHIEYDGTMEEWQSLNDNGGYMSLMCTVIKCADGNVHEVHSCDSYQSIEKATLTADGTKEGLCACGEMVTEKVDRVTSINLKTTSYIYDGDKKFPAAEVKDAVGMELVKDVDYTVTYTNNQNIGEATATITGIGNYEFTKELTFSIKAKDLAAPSKVTTSLYGYDDVKITWSKVSGANGYAVYYKKSTSSSYTLLGRTTGTSMKKSNLADGGKYYFRVYPCVVDGNGYHRDGSYKSSSIYTLKKVSGVKAVRSGTKVKVSWSNIYGESGYQISRFTKKTGTSIVKTYSTTSGKYYSVSATKGKTYYYKVRAYKTVSGKKIYGPWSTAVKYRR